MKTKSFLLIFCLLAGTALTSFSQKKTDRTVNTWENTGYYTYVSCDGGWVDYVKGTVELKLTEHFDKNGELVWEKWHFKGVVTGYFGETFKMKSFERFDAASGVYSWRYHLQGDEGSHYIGTITITADGTWVVGKTVCH